MTIYKGSSLDFGKSKGALVAKVQIRLAQQIQNLVFWKDLMKPSQRSSDIRQCMICFRIHPLRHCKQFLALSIEERKRMVRIHKYCMNCLARSHTTDNCISDVVCQRCGCAHHTLLHMLTRVRTSSQPSQSTRGNSQATPRRSQSASRTQHVSRRSTRSNVRNRLGPYARPRQSRCNRSADRIRRSPGETAQTPRRILRDVQRALERLARTI